MLVIIFKGNEWIMSITFLG